MKILDYLKDNVVYLDGGTGTILQELGLKPGELPENWNITHTDEIKNIHKRYYDAGSNVVSTNTFGANDLKFDDEQLEKIVSVAVENVKWARANSSGKQEKFVALDIGPVGRLLKPFGDLEFEEAIKTFAKTIKMGVACGVDLIFIETMSDSYETKAAVIAAKENCDLPIFVSNAYNENQSLLTGASAEAVTTMLEGLGVNAIGVNCSLGPEQLIPVTSKIFECSSVPVIFKPNRGIPKIVNGKTTFDMSPQEFALQTVEAIKKGARIVGGCCGTTPEFISEIVSKTKSLKPLEITEKSNTVISSYTHVVDFKNVPVLIGERINPTGKKRFKQALREGDVDYILQEAINQQERKVDVLDVNVGLPEIDEVEMLKRVTVEIQAVINLPLQIDTTNVEAMEQALRLYNGKALINSVNGKEESMNAIFPLVKKYGGVVVALTLDENGIPSTAQGRVEIAKKILKVAEKFGIKKKDVIFDTLAMTVSADNFAGLVTLSALKTINDELGCRTSLGISNVSFGLPNRDTINSVFFACALQNGLSAAIMNPYSQETMKTFYAFKTLHGLDENCAQYIDFANNLQIASPQQTETVNVTVVPEKDDFSPLKKAVIKGLKEQVKGLAKELLKSSKPLDVINDEIIPALDEVGKRFEAKTAFLPQLLMSAECAKVAFDIIKEEISNSNSSPVEKCPFVIATVKGDIHDIGKNIVKLLLENYGFKVVDLGKDVDPQEIVEKVLELKSPLCGLSALMTTTVPAMEETIKLLHKQAPFCKVVVGGAVLTKEYAEMINADAYAKDALDTVKFAEKIFVELKNK